MRNLQIRANKFNKKHIMRSYLLTTVILISSFFNLQAQVKKQRPNIVIIISDDHAYQTIGAYGSTLAETPNIDRIANEGAVFNKAFVTNSICGPSRATLLTGKYSHKNGFKDNETSNFDHGQDLFVKRLQTSGYKTAWIGKQHLGNKPQGFDYYDILPGQGQYYNPDFIGMDGSVTRTEGYVTNIITDKAEAWLDQQGSEEPFCLIIGHKATHRTWLPDTSDFGKYDDKTFPLPANFYDDYEGRVAAKGQQMSIVKDMVMGYDLKMLSDDEKTKEGSVSRMNEDQLKKFNSYYDPIYDDLKSRNLKGKELGEWKYQRYIKDYLSTAASMDRNIGRVLDYLDEHNLTENTVVIYLSDQGFYMGEHGWFDKRFMYEESFRTPMVARYPGVIKPHSEINGFAMNLDIAPTMLEIAGVDIPSDMQGVSILPLMTGEKKNVRKELFYHYYENGEHAVSPHFGVRTNRYKLIHYYKRVEEWELFDLKKDPQEMNNLYGKKGNQRITKNLKHLLNQQIIKFEDEDARRILE